MFKDICYRQGAQYCPICSPSGRIYYGLQTGYLEDKKQSFLSMLLFTMKFLRIFFRMH